MVGWLILWCSMCSRLFGVVWLMFVLSFISGCMLKCLILFDFV